jgi:hypothetical protein
MAGELQTFYYVVFPDGRKQKLPDGRTVKFDSFYISKSHDGVKQHDASRLTRGLAEQIVERHKNRNPIIKSDTYHDFGDTTVNAELWQVGEADAPKPTISTSVGALEDAVRAAMAELSKPDVLNIVGRILLSHN